MNRYRASALRRRARVAFFLIFGAVSGAAVYVGEPLAAMLGVFVLLVAGLATSTGAVRPALPAYLLGVGLTGMALSIALSGAFSAGTSGHSSVCSSAGGCVGSTVTQSAVSVPAIAVFATILVLGAIWLTWQAIRSRVAESATRG
jgi:hypothetical protein